MAELNFRLLAFDEFDDLVDSAEEHFEDYVVAVGSAGGGVKKAPGRDFVRVGDFLFPSTPFDANHCPPTNGDYAGDLLASFLAPSEHYNASHERVYSIEEYREHVEEFAEQFDDPYVFIGSLSPEGNYRRYGGEKKKPRYVANTLVPYEAVSQPGMKWLDESKTTFSGLLLVEGDALTDEAKAFGRGETDTLDLGDASEKQCMEEEDVIELVESLTPGDKVLINDRSIALTVVPRSEAGIRPSTASVAVLNGHGTSYRIDVVGDHYPRLEYATDSQIITDIEVERGEQSTASADQQTLATDGSGDSFSEVCNECGRHVAVAGHAPDCSNGEDGGRDE